MSISLFYIVTYGLGSIIISLAIIIVRLSAGEGPGSELELVTKNQHYFCSDKSL